MTDVADAVMNGEGGDLETGIEDKTLSPPPESESETQSSSIPVEGEKMDSDEIDLMGDSSNPADNDNGENEQEYVDEDDEDSEMNAESGLILDSETGILEDTNTSSSPEVIGELRFDGDVESSSQPDEPEFDEDEPNSTEESEETLLISNASGGTTIRFTSTSSIRNGETIPSEDSRADDKPLSSDRLTKEEGSVSISKTPSQSRSFSVADGNAIVKDLEDQVSQLNTLLVLKEKEWSAILRLKKHVEYALDQVKCTQRMSKMQEGHNGPLSPTDMKACLSLILSDKEVYEYAERQIEDSIECAESENESLQAIFPFKSQNQMKDGVSIKSDSDIFTATAALQKLCERKRKALDELTPGRATRLRIVDVQSASSQMQSKVIGNGRQGAIVDVQSIIQSHRTGSGDKLDKLKMSKKGAFNPSLNMPPERQYYKTLEELMALVEADKYQKDSPATVSSLPLSILPQVNRPIAIAPKAKNGKAPRQPGGNPLLANPTPSSSGTLAKMLSPSTHSITTNRNSNELTANPQKFITKLPNAEANLSLANLLATSKVDTKINISKMKKERNARDDDTAQVPSQDAVPICQGCNLSRAQFVCAGCANQWYCSRECQVAAWDEHSEICSG